MTVNPHVLKQVGLAEKARRSFAEFVRQAWEYVDPSPLRWNWHIEVICAHLQAVSEGRIRKIVINIPPGHAKSLLVAVLWPAWEWTWKPTAQSIFSSYAQDLAERDSLKCRDLIKQDWYRNNFVDRKWQVGEQIYEARPGDVEPWILNPAQNRVNSFKNTAGGIRQCLSVGSKATGFRADKVVVDDPINMTEIFSEVVRAGVIHWWTKVMSTRVNNRSKAAFVIIMQRGHEEDLSGHVLAGGDYEHLCLPSIYEPDRHCVTYVRRISDDRKSFVKDQFFEDPRALTPKKPDGEPCETCLPKRLTESEQNDTPVDQNCVCDLLFPTLFSRRDLEELSDPIDGLGEDGFAGQHQQRPSSAEGGILKRKWWRFWRPDGTAAPGRAPRPKGCLTPEESPAVVLPRLHQVICSVDAAFKDTKRSDYVVASVWGVHFSEKYLLFRFRAKVDFTKTCTALVGCEKGRLKRCRGCAACVASLRARFPKIRKWLMEDKANGPAIVNTLKKFLAGLIEVNPEGGKEARAAAAQPALEAGQCFLPEGEEWLEEWVGECAAFPKGKHDDQVDSFSQFVIYVDANPDVNRALALANSM